MEFKLVEKIRERSREEWVRWANQKLVDIRIWLQEHGEAALGIGIVAGVVVVVEFFNVLVLLLLLAAAAFAIWSIALPGTTPNKEQATNKEPEKQADADLSSSITGVPKKN